MGEINKADIIFINLNKLIMKRVLFFVFILNNLIVNCQIHGDFNIKENTTQIINKEGKVDMLYTDNLNMDNNSSLILNDMTVYINNDIKLCRNCKLKLNNSKVYYKGDSNAISKNIIKLSGKIKVEDISILSKYPNKSFNIINRGITVLKGTYNQKKNIKLDNDLYDIWIQGEGFLNNVLLTNFKL